MIVENRGIGNTSHLLKGEDFFNAVYDLLAHHGKSSGNLFADNVPVFFNAFQFYPINRCYREES